MEFWDDYEHRDPKVTYICENIKTREIEDVITSELSGCECENECLPKACLCVQRSGALYSFVDENDLKNYTVTITDTNKPAYECNSNCKCNILCGNKLVQFGPHKGLRIVEIDMPMKGLGLVTTHQIEKGNFICEYAGEVITGNEAHHRYKTYSQLALPHNYIFCINENFGERKENTFIDPTFYGNVGRYINHSCAPNCILLPIRIHDAVPKLCIFSNEMIKENTEITFSYGENNNSIKECFCGALNCRKFLPFDTY